MTIFGLRRHAGGSLGQNTHATGGVDAIVPSDIGAGIPFMVRTFDTSFTGNPGTVETEITGLAVAASGARALVPMHIFARVLGSATTNYRARVRLAFTDGTTLDCALSPDSGLTANLLHYDYSANPATADGWAAAETAVNLHTVIGTAHNQKKINRISLRGFRSNAGADNGTFRLVVSAYEV